MRLILNNIFYVIPVLVFAVIVFLKRHFLIEKLKETRTIIWIIVLIIVFLLIYLLRYNTYNNEFSLHRINNFGPETYEHILFFACILGGFCWFILKLICNGRGYPVSFFLDHHSDIKNSLKIIKHDENGLIKLFTGIMLIGVFTSLIVVIITLFSI